MKKDCNPGFFDLATGGVVGFEEDDDESAQREVAEELGIPDASLEKIKVIKIGDPSRVFGNVYLLRDFDPEAVPLTLQEDEVDEVVYWTKEEILERAAQSDAKITSDSLEIFNELVQDGVL